LFYPFCKARAQENMSLKVYLFHWVGQEKNKWYHYRGQAKTVGNKIYYRR
jgi:hypothetical protein